MNEATAQRQALRSENGYGQADDRCRADWPYRELAAWIIKQSLEDAVLSHDQTKANVDGNKFQKVDNLARHRALVFLFGSSGKAGRDLWLAWLNLTEEGLWMLMASDERFGERNRLPEWLKKAAMEALCKRTH